MPESIHRLAAIMFTDIVGYTALMGSDESNALLILRKSREIQKAAVEKNEGIWLKEMGDGVLAQFNSALDAVNAALEIQQAALEGLEAKIRIGIHLGDVTIEHQDVFGDGVNIASRIQSVADPGGIYISESVNEAVHAHWEISTQLLGDLSLKNVNRPIKVYYILQDGLPIPNQSKIRELSQSKSNSKVKYILTALAVILIAYLGGRFLNELPAEIRSIAVLPVANLSGDTTTNVLLAGIHGELRDEIAKIGALRVISRRSTTKYLEGQMTISEIAKELNVDAIVEPDILAFGASVKMEVRFISTLPDEQQLWSRTFTKPASEVFSIFAEVALAVAEQSGIILTRKEADEFKLSAIVNPEAHEAYLKGIDNLYKGTPSALDKALEYFNLSLEKDPDYARAHLGISAVWGFRKQMGYTSYDEAQSYIEREASKAIELDSSLTEVHYMLAVANAWNYWNWEKANREFIRTIEMDPYHAEARAYYAHFLIIIHKSDMAAVQMEKAIELEPYNAWVNGLYGMYLNHTRQYEKAEKILKKELENAPNPLASTALWTLYHNLGRYQEAMESAREVYTEKREYVVVEKLITGYQEGGYRLAMERVAEAFQVKKDTTFFPSWQLATLYTRADNKEEAVKWLYKAYDEHDQNMPSIAYDPIFDNIEDQSGFKDLLTKMKLSRN